MFGKIVYIGDSEAHVENLQKEASEADLMNMNVIFEENVTFEEYIIDNLGGLRVQYQSSFVINDDKYNWIGTVILWK